MSDKQKLMPCPFCGSNAEAWPVGIDGENYYSCSDATCPAFGPASSVLPEVWNYQQAAPLAMAEMHDMLDDARQSLDLIREALGVPSEPHQGMVERILEAAQELKSQQQAQAVPDGYALLPTELTAENGAKYALSGEFSETIALLCPDCDGGEYQDTETDHCGTCSDTGEIEQRVTVSWSTIKEIYARALQLATHKEGE